ncbi:MAG: helix-turn-helix domain-containing protein [Butyricicoccus sp.]
MLTFRDHNSGNSIYFQVNDICDGSIQWYEGLKIVYLLNGSADLSLEDTIYHLQKNDFIVINPFSPHTLLLSKGSNSLSLYISPALIQQVFHKESFPRFLCCSAACPRSQAAQFHSIRVIFAALFRAVYREQKNITPFLYSRVFELLDILSCNFQDEEAAAQGVTGTVDNRFGAILQDINTNARTNLTIAAVAKRHYMTASTLSRFFQKQLGTTFTRYLNTVRLSSAFAELMHTKKTVTEIAMDYGFKSTNAFIKVFRQQYGTTPGRFRLDQHLSPQTEDPPASELFLELLSIEEQHAEPIQPEAMQHMYHIHAAQRGPRLRHTWKNLVNIGYAKEGLLSTVQEQLRRVQKEIGFRYIHFQGLLDDDMMVYTEDSDGNPRLNFSFVDTLFDFILSIGLLPYVEFGFMPALLAKHKERHFRRGVYMCVPNDIGKWLYMIRAFLDHFEERYGRRLVQQWHFCIININCAVIGGHDDFEEYCELYLRTYRLIKSIDPAYQISGPGGYAGGTWQDRYIRRFFEVCLKNDCVPDQFSFLCYPYNPIQDTDIYRFMLDTQPIHPEALSADENFVKHAIAHFRRMLQEVGMPHDRITLEAWNSTMWQRDLCSDTCFKSAYLVKNIVENYDQTQGMGCWTLIDMMEEIEPTTDLFHGGFGLCTFQGIPKPALGALRLLTKLGDYFLFSGDGCFAARSSNSVQIVLYNYCHYHALYRHHFSTSTEEASRHVYENFVEGSDLEFHLQVTGLNAGRYELRRYSISRQCGSPFDFWQNMGAPLRLNEEEFAFLRHAADPAYQISQFQTEGSVTLHTTVTPHEVQVLVLTLH